MALFEVQAQPVFLTCGNRRARQFGMARRPTCGRTLPVAAFDRRADGSRSPVCSTCRHLYGGYRIGFEDWHRIADDQGGVCAIAECGTPVEYGTGAAGAHVDHDHACQHPGKGTYSCRDCVRGLLCQACNTAIGYVERSPQRVQGWLDYLAKWAAPCL